MRALLRRLAYLIRRHRHDADLRAEMEAHRAHRQEALERDGLAPADAARASRRAMGNVTLAAEDARDVWVVRTVDAICQDVRIAGRGLRRSPGFTVVAVATLALGIGANTALFSIFNSLILRQLPVRDPWNLALLADGDWAFPVWQEIAARDTQLFEGAFAWSAETFDLSHGGRTAIVDGAYVSGGFFDVLGVPAACGRMLAPADDSRAAPDGPVAVISFRFWRQRFSGADVIGRQLTVERLPFTIVGVMPPEFSGVDVGRVADVILPIAAEPLIQGRESRLASIGTIWLQIMVRLKAEQNLQQANAALRAVQPQIREAALAGSRQPAAAAARFLAEPLTLVPAATGNSPLRTRFGTPLIVLVVAVGLVLLVACANIAGLQVARALARRRELGVRLALGGSRWRLAQLLFVESLIVATMGAALGLALAIWSSALLVRQLSTWESTVSLDLALDWRVLTFTAVVACLSAVVAGVAPVLGLRSVAADEALRAAGRGIAGDRRLAVRGTLVVAQIAVTLVLVMAAGLFVRTFASLNRLPLGFVPEPLLIAELNLQASGTSIGDRGRRVERLRDAAAAVTGVQSASVSAVRLLTGGGWASNTVGIADGPLAPENRRQRIWRNATTPGWFETMGIPVRSGRDFRAGDRLGSPPVAIVNEAFVRRFMAGQRPVGQTIRLADPGPRYEIVGVVGDAVYTLPRDGMLATIYVPLAQRDPDAFWPTVQLTLGVAAGRRTTVEREVSAALARTDPAVSFAFRTFDQFLDATVTRERLVAMLSGFLGGLALLLAGIGLHGTVAQAVRLRRTEIGVRMALGASPRGIVRLVLRRIGVLVVTGVGLGAAGSWSAAQLVEPLLFQVQARDPATFSAAAGVLLGVAVLAAWVPARRAARLDPAEALREG